MDCRKLLSAALCLVLAGCGSSSSTATSPETTLEVTEPTAEAVAETTPTPEPTPTPTPEPKTFLEEQGITITPQGDFEYTAWAKEGTFPMHASITIHEEPAETEGYKKVIASVTYDVSDWPGGNVLTREFPFDRYTGTCFDTTNELAQHLETGNTEEIQTGGMVEYEGKTYDVTFTTTRTNNWPMLGAIMTVVCPEEYDGTVFVVRYADEETNVEDTAYDWTKPSTIDQLPFYNTVETFYFTLTDE